MTDPTEPDPTPPEDIRPFPLPVLMGRVLADVADVGKTEKAPANMGGYSFRGIEAIIAALKPACSRHGVFFIPKTLERRDTERTVSGGKIMFCVDLKMRWTFRGPAGDRLKVGPVWGTGTDMGDKAVQKAMTAAEKSMLVQVFQIGESATDSERHDVPQTERAETDWFVGHGWLGGKAQHDDRRRIISDGVAALGEKSKATFGEWWSDQGTAWAAPWPADLAEKVAAKVDELAETPQEADTPHPLAEAAAEAPKATTAATEAAEGEPTGLGNEDLCGQCHEPLPLVTENPPHAMRAVVGADGKMYHAKHCPLPEPDPNESIETLRDRMAEIKS